MSSFSRKLLEWTAPLHTDHSRMSSSVGNCRWDVYTGESWSCLEFGETSMTPYWKWHGSPPSKIRPRRKQGRRSNRPRRVACDVGFASQLGGNSHRPLVV